LFRALDVALTLAGCGKTRVLTGRFQFDISNLDVIRVAFELAAKGKQGFRLDDRQVNVICLKFSKPCFGRGCREHLF
jgi:hypothetical protein